LDYFELLRDQMVRNNVQAGVDNHPIDFVAARIPLETLPNGLRAELRSTDDLIWLSGTNGRQALLLSRTNGNGGEYYRYLPVTDLRQDAGGRVTFRFSEWGPGYPLKLYEDKELNTGGADKEAWLRDWHSELDWLHATHKTAYSIAMIGLNEQMDRHPFVYQDQDAMSAEQGLISDLRARQRRLTEADILILANSHWNFDVRGFNPGGNHGSFFRVSTNATFMMAGGTKTGIPRGLEVTEPYDSLSFMPTLLALMGKIDGKNNPVPELYDKGFRRFPGRVVSEIVRPQDFGHGK